MITPPFGINMFYLQGVAPPGVDTKVMYKAVMPYVIIFLVACFFMMLFPELIVIFRTLRWDIDLEEHRSCKDPGPVPFDSCNVVLTHLPNM